MCEVNGCRAFLKCSPGNQNVRRLQCNREKNGVQRVVDAEKPAARWAGRKAAKNRSAISAARRPHGVGNGQNIDHFLQYRRRHGVQMAAGGDGHAD